MRRRTRSVALAVLVGAVGLGAGSTLALDAIEQAGSVEQTAERIVEPVTGPLFPIDPEPVCLVFNNFGGYSKSRGSGGHQGVDIGADQWQEVYAVESGVLYEQHTDLGSAPGLGWRLLASDGTAYRYYHLADFADGLEEGSVVTKGEVIGYVGDTGNATPGGYHLHFEVRPGPQPQYGSTAPVDPVPLLEIPPTCTVYAPTG